MNIIKKTKEHTTKLSMSGKIKKSYRIYCMVVVLAALIFGASVTAFAAMIRLRLLIICPDLFLD